MKKIKNNILEIDIIDGCNAKCVCCPRGLGLLGNSMTKMDYELYKKVIDKAHNIGINEIVLFSWSEPFLHPQLKDFCKYAKEQNMNVDLSTNLSFNNIDFQDILLYVDSLII